MKSDSTRVKAKVYQLPTKRRVTKSNDNTIVPLNGPKGYKGNAMRKVMKYMWVFFWLTLAVLWMLTTSGL